jgi:hypothetical protein
VDGPIPEAHEVPANIYNDEITSPIVSPSMYEEFILPTEVELSRFYGGLSYWHSCVNTTPSLGLINSIPNTQMIHVSPWTDLHGAVTCYDKNKFLELDLHPYEDVLYPESDMCVAQRLETIKGKSRMSRRVSGTERPARESGFFLRPHVSCLTAGSIPGYAVLRARYGAT